MSQRNILMIFIVANCKFVIYGLRLTYDVRVRSQELKEGPKAQVS